ncbi:MAG: hypothetical protein ACRDL7_03715 [Gaiellaceae bacterium]
MTYQHYNGYNPNITLQMMQIGENKPGMKSNLSIEQACQMSMSMVGLQLASARLTAAKVCKTLAIKLVICALQNGIMVEVSTFAAPIISRRAKTPG